MSAGDQPRRCRSTSTPSTNMPRKRWAVRADAVHQYSHLSGAFAISTGTRTAIPILPAIRLSRTDVLMIGGGFAALLAGAWLQAGVKDIRIVERR